MNNASKTNVFFKVLLLLSLAIGLRVDLINFKSADFLYALDPWYQFILDNGKFWALKYQFANYNPPYLYLLILWSYLFPNLSNLYAVKTISIVFDFIGAYLATRLMVQKFVAQKFVVQKYAESGFKGKLPYVNRLQLQSIFLAILLTPTVVLNSACWGQCDMIYTATLLAFVYWVNLRRTGWALVAFTLAVSIKLQAIFLFPLLVILIFRGIIPWQLLPIMPLTYIALLFPARIAGRPWNELMSIYWQQFNTYQQLTLNAPNLYQWIPNNYYEFATVSGTILTLSIVTLLIVLIGKHIQRFEPGTVIHLGLLFSILVPFCLPKMHDRYFFIADVFSVIFAFYFPRYCWIAILVVSVSLLSYAPYLLAREVIPLKILSIVLGFTLVQIIYLLFQSKSITQTKRLAI